jgi:hypothetical protein
LNSVPLLTSEEVGRLLAQQSISQEHPWASNNEQVIYAHLRTVCDKVERATGLKALIDQEHYGCGYASFLDAWFHRPFAMPDFKRNRRHMETRAGLVVLLSSLSPFFVFMEGMKSWSYESGGTYLPDFGMVDDLKNPEVLQLAEQVQPILEGHGLVRAYRDQLNALLPPGTRVATLFNSRMEGYCQFDALFHWED